MLARSFRRGAAGGAATPDSRYPAEAFIAPSRFSASIHVVHRVVHAQLADRRRQLRNPGDFLQRGIVIDHNLAHLAWLVGVAHTLIHTCVPLLVVFEVHRPAALDFPEIGPNVPNLGLDKRLKFVYTVLR